MKKRSGGLPDLTPQVELVVVPYDTRDDALAAERALREAKRAAGWQVSPDR